MTPRWPVILFDLDGTLADSINLIVTSYQHAFREVIGREWDEAEIKSWIGKSLIDAFRGALGPELGEEAYASYTTFNEANTERLMKGYEGVPELLRDLKAAGVKTGVVTSKRRPPAEWAIRLCKLDIPAAGRPRGRTGSQARSAAAAARARAAGGEGRGGCVRGGCCPSTSSPRATPVCLPSPSRGARASAPTSRPPTRSHCATRPPS